MRFLSTFIFILILGTSLGQDTLHYVDMDVIYVNDKIVEKICYKNGQIDIRVIYIYKDGVLLRREWWQRGKRISYTLEN
jgi:antitoxin component YwqK of YwqJK toxin-antitoxin module